MAPRSGRPPTTATSSRIPVGRLGQRADDRVEVVRLEPVGRLVQVEEIRHPEQVDAGGAQLRMPGEQVEDREPAGGPADRHHAASVAPAPLGGRPHPVSDVGHVQVTPAAMQRLGVLPAVTGRAPVVRQEDRPTALEEEGRAGP